MQYVYNTQGTCSKQIAIETEDGKIKSVSSLGGCSGNFQGIARLVEGMKIEEVIARLEGVQCGMKGTSCPDQLSRALKSISEKEKK